MDIIKSHIVVDEVALDKNEIKFLEDLKAICNHHTDCCICPFSDSLGECIFKKMPTEWKMDDFPKEVEDVKGTDN